jgi:hypothetical protein
MTYYFHACSDVVVSSYIHSLQEVCKSMGQKYGTQCLKKSEGLGPSLYLKEKLLLMLLNNIFIHIYKSFIVNSYLYVLLVVYIFNFVNWNR